MKSAASIGNLPIHQQQQQQLAFEQYQHQNQINTGKAAAASATPDPTTPICKCRVMYLGSSVPHVTKDGLQGIQEPLRELYPDQQTIAAGNAGIDSWLSVWSNGVLIENIDENGQEVKRFFQIEALHYCAAVKYVYLTQQLQQQSRPFKAPSKAATQPKIFKFLPLDSPITRQSTSEHQPVFACILRRTTGIKVLECHAFICKRESAANALVRCCFHAYADTMYAKQIGADLNNNNNNNNNSNNNTSPSSTSTIVAATRKKQQQEAASNSPGSTSMPTRKSKSIAALNEANGHHQQQMNEAWRKKLGGDQQRANDEMDAHRDSGYEYSNYGRGFQDKDYDASTSRTLHSQKSSKSSKAANEQLLFQQQKLSKSMHHLHATQDYNRISKLTASQYARFGDFTDQRVHPSTAISLANLPSPLQAAAFWQQEQQEQQLLSQVPAQMSLNQPFFNPYAIRVPSYPPHLSVAPPTLAASINPPTSNGGTLRSIKSLAANSLASTLLKSKRHAKAMSIAQMSPSIHQQHQRMSNTLSGPLLAPVPPMFLPNFARTIVSGSQTMKAPSRSMVKALTKQANFETMTPKEVKKILKKSAKYGIDPSKLGAAENGLPLFAMPGSALPPPPSIPPPIPPPQMFGMSLPASKSGTMLSQHYQSAVDPFLQHDIPDFINNKSAFASRHPSQLSPPPPPLDAHQQLQLQQMQMQMQMPPRPILVKPNLEFLKSKAGKKWIKQQKEFKKLLPPHLEGLPIVFGPPPPEAIEPASGNSNPYKQSTTIPNSMPVQHHLDASGFCGLQPHGFSSATGRMSTSSTLLRYSPNSQFVDDVYHQRMAGASFDLLGQANRSQHAEPHHKRYASDESSLVMGTSECSADIYSRPRHRSRSKSSMNHMVEQRVISLGDENDEIDDDDAEVQESHIDCCESANNNNASNNSQRRSNKDSSVYATSQDDYQNLNGEQRHYEQLRQQPEVMQHGGRKEKQQSAQDRLAGYGFVHAQAGHTNGGMDGARKSQEHYNVPYDHQDGYANGLSKKSSANGYSKQMQMQAQEQQLHHSLLHNEANDLSARLDSQLNMNRSSSYANGSTRK